MVPGAKMDAFPANLRLLATHYNRVLWENNANIKLDFDRIEKSIESSEFDDLPFISHRFF